MKERVGKNIKRVIIIAAATLLALCMAGIIMVRADDVKAETKPNATFSDADYNVYHDKEAEDILGPVGSFHLVAFDTLYVDADLNGNIATNNLYAKSQRIATRNYDMYPESWTH
jgi:hypothetical protein